MQSLVVLNFAYWTALAGTQMTLLPLLMVSPHFSLGATEIGSTFAFMSVISVATSQPIAILSDRLGKDATIIGGGAFVCAAMLAMPLAASFPQLLGCIVPLAVGSTALTTAPLARISDFTTPAERAQALSLLRTAGDLGLLLGATGSGILADLVGMESVITANGGLIGISACWFAARAMNQAASKST
jgi:MFS family permease